MRTVYDIMAWVGIVVAGLIVLGIALEGLGLLAFYWLDRHMSRKQKIIGTAVLLVVAMVFATHGLLQFYGR